MVCCYDKLRSGQIAKRGAWNTCASKAEAVMLDLTPTAPPAHYERPRGGSNVSKGASAGCMRAREPYLSDARSRVVRTGSFFRGS